MKIKGYLFAALSAASYGTIPLFALPLKSQGVSVDTTLTYRFLLAAAIIGLYMLFRKMSFKVSKKDALTLIVAGLIFGASSFCLFESYNYMPAGVAATILFLYPIIVALIMTFVFKEKSSWVLWTSLALAFLGIYLLNEGGTNTGGSVPLIGFTIIVGSAIFYGLYLIFINKSPIQTMSGTKLTFYSMLVAGIFFLIKSSAQGSLHILPDSKAWFDMVMLAAFSTAMSCITMVYAVKYIGSTTTAVMGAVEPVVAVAIGVTIFHEALTPNLITGIILILIAVTLIILSSQIVNETHHAKVYVMSRLFSIRKRSNRKHF